MSKAVLRSTLAYQDIIGIGADVAQLMQSFSAAKRVLDKIEETIKVISLHPRLGKVRPDLHREVRQISVSEYDYLIFYRITDDGIQIVRVLHASQDVPSIFQSS